MFHVFSSTEVKSFSQDDPKIDLVHGSIPSMLEAPEVMKLLRCRHVRIPVILEMFEAWKGAWHLHRLAMDA